jgi:translation initiation factor 2D
MEMETMMNFHNEDNEKERKFENVDDILNFGFLNALKLKGKNIQLPLLISTFYPQYIMPELPATLNIRKTSYKNVGTFLKEMAIQGFITIIEEKKGIEKVYSINLEHPEILSFRPYNNQRLRKKSTIEDSGRQKLLTEMTKVYAVTEETAELFAHFNCPLRKTLDKSQIKNHIRDYIRQNKLKNPENKLIYLDDVLKEICHGEDTVISAANLTQIVIDRMTSTFEMRSHNGPVIRSGKVIKIHITVARTKFGRKVTLIGNLQDYNINMAELSKLLKIQCSSSVTTKKVPGHNNPHLLVQGNHVQLIYNTLVNNYKIPSSSITGLAWVKVCRRKRKTLDEKKAFRKRTKFLKNPKEKSRRKHNFLMLHYHEELIGRRKRRKNQEKGVKIRAKSTFFKLTLPMVRSIFPVLISYF